MRIKTDAAKQTARDRTAKLRKENIASGTCTMCGKSPALKTMRTCGPCRELQSIQNKQRYVLKAIAASGSKWWHHVD